MHQWYVVHTKPRQEVVARTNLERQGYTTYYPQIPRSRRRRQSWQQLAEPLFPRYLFVRLALGEDDFAPIRSTLGVMGLVRFGNRPGVVSEQAITAIRRREALILNDPNACHDWKTGDIVEVVYGPLAGIQGIFQSVDGAERVLILMNMLGRQNTITVRPDNLASA